MMFARLSGGVDFRIPGRLRKFVANWKNTTKKGSKADLLLLTDYDVLACINYILTTALILGR